MQGTIKQRLDSGLEPINPKSKIQNPKSKIGKVQNPKLNHERRILLLTLMAGGPAVLMAMIIIWTGDYSDKVQWTVTVFLLGLWLGFSFVVRERVVYPLQVLSNLLAALREGDFSLRARGAHLEDALGEVMLEVNALGATLREQRLEAMEATALLRTVMAEIDVAVFAFDGDQCLRLVNQAGARLLARPTERLLGHHAADLGLAECLNGDPTRMLQMTFPGGVGRWRVRRSTIWEQGLPHQLLVLTDLSQALREEERQAWQRIVRVLGHELNNSLAPIKSIAGSLSRLLSREPLPHDWREDMQSGLAVMATRAEALSRFMETYARLARLPQPRFRPMPVGDWIRRVASLETRLNVTIVPGPELTIQADSDQLEQLLINLVQNAVDASLETGGTVQVGWAKRVGYLEVWVEDEGPGLPKTSNLFVPFFTTKPGGSGIGLVLSRQIVEAHGGSLTLENRSMGRGCEARLRLPLELTS